MVDMVYTWNVQTKTWNLCRDDKLRHGDIRNLPWALAIKFNNCYDVCINGTAMQGVKNLGDLNNFSGLVSCLQHRECHNVYLFPLRWRIYQGNNRNYILIGVDCIEAKMIGYGYCSYELRGFRDEFVSYSVDIGKRRNVPAKRQYMYSLMKNMKSEAISIPDNIANAICQLMQEEAGRVLELRPTVNMRPHGWDFIEKFVSRPYDVNIAYWENILGKTEYEARFPYEQKDNYKPLCQYLGIRKPPKSLRKAYGENPYAPMIYLLMQQLGLRDINYIRRFFAFEEDVMQFYLHRFRFDPRSHRIYRDRQCDGDRWCEIENFCNFVAERKSQKHLAAMLYRLSVMPIEEYNRYVVDVYSMFNEYRRDISEDMLKLLADKGPTHTVHDLMANELRGYKKENKVVEYEAKLLPLECMLDDYEFHLVHETAELQEIGVKLYNCVDSYRGAVLAGRSIICYVKKKGEYLACIEIAGKNKVVQAYAYNNQNMTGDLLKHFLYWAKVKKLFVDAGYISDMDVAALEEEYPEKELLIKHVSTMTYEELMAVDGNSIGKGWYTRFGELLPQQRNYHLAPPPWMNDEEEEIYLHYALPEGEKLIEAAAKENPEAMTVLGIMYFQGQVLKQDHKRALAWLYKSAKKYHDAKAWKYLLQLPNRYRANNVAEDVRLAYGLERLRKYNEVSDVPPLI